MSKTNKIRRLEKENARLEVTNESQQKEIIELKAKVYSLQLANTATRQELEVLLMLTNTPNLLQDQAH